VCIRAVETPHLAILIQMILSVFYVFTEAMTLVSYMGFA
jgi:hypothetical protein